jgi:hypothetical protein
MFHIQGVPFKVGYLLLLGFFFANLPSRGLSAQLTALLALLAVITMAVWLKSWGFGETTASGPILIIVASYLMAATAFVLGKRSGVSVLRYTPHLIIGYFVVNVLVIIFWSQLIGTTFGNTYGYVPDFLGSGTKLVRAGGLHQNPNVSARFMTVLFLGLFVSVRFGVVNLRSPLVILAVIFGLVLPIMVSSRSETLVSMVIMAGILWVTFRRSGGDKNVVLLVLVLFAAAMVVVQILLPDVSRNVEARVKNTITTVRSDPFNRTDGLARPVAAWVSEGLWVRVSNSPVVGNGDGPTWFHNDWATILVRSGVIGFGLFLFIAFGVARVHIIFLAPLLISAMTNIFIFSPQHFTLFMMIVGMASQEKLRNPLRMSGPLEPMRGQLQSISGIKHR